MPYRPASFLTDPADEQADYLAATNPTGPRYVAPDPSDADPASVAGGSTGAAIITPAPNMPPPSYTDPDLDPNAYSPVAPAAPSSQPSYLDPDLDPNAYAPVNPNAGKAAKYRQDEADLLANRPEDKSPGAWRTIGAIGAGIATGYLTRDRSMVHNVEDRIMHPGAANVQKWASDVNDAELRAQQAEKIDADAQAATKGQADLAHTQSETGYQNALAQNLGRPTAPTPVTKEVEVIQPDGTKKTEIHYYPDPNKPTQYSVLGTPPSVEKPLTTNDFIETVQPDGSTHWMLPDPKNPRDPSKATDYGVKKKDDPRTPAQMAWDQTDETLPVAERSKAAMKILSDQAKASRPITNNSFQLPGLPTAPETPEQKAETGEAYLSRLSPSLAAQVRQVAMGGLSMPPASARSTPAIQLRDAVMHYDPQMSEQRAQTRKAFTTGPDGKNIGALNTATVHLGQLQEAAEAMKNGTFQPGNDVYNYIATKFGATAPQNYNFVMNALAGETATALKGSATDPEIAHVASTLGQNMAPDQALGVTQAGLHVLGAKLNTYKERYEQQIPGDTVWSPVLPSAKAVFDKYGVNPTAGAANGTGAGTGTYKFTAVGPNGHKIGSNGGPWVDLQTGKAVQ